MHSSQAERRPGTSPGLDAGDREEDLKRDRADCAVVTGPGKVATAVPGDTCGEPDSDRPDAPAYGPVGLRQVHRRFGAP